MELVTLVRKTSVRKGVLAARPYAILPRLLALLVCLSVACRREVPAEYQDFYALSSQQQVETFRTYAVDKQVSVYLYEWKHEHPPQIGFAHTIAEGGEKNVPYLLDRLRQERDERNQEALINIFHIIVDRNFLQDPNTKEEVVKLVTEIHIDLKDPVIKERVRQWLNDMKARPPS